MHTIEPNRGSGPLSPAFKSFLVKRDNIPAEQGEFLERISAGLQQGMPWLVLHKVFGENANWIVMADHGPQEKPRFTIGVLLGPQCSSGRCGGPAMETTLNNVRDYILLQPEIATGQYSLMIQNKERKVLANWSPTPG